MEDRAPQWGSTHGSVSPLAPFAPPPLPLSRLRLLSVTNLHPWRRAPPRPPGPGGPALRCGVEHADGPLSQALQRPSGPGPLWHRAEPGAELPGTAQMSSLLQPDFTGVAVIDWEEWRPLWERNFGTKMEYRRQSKLLVRRERPDLSESATAVFAKLKFEESARRFMGETLQSAVRLHPKGLWGFYGFPECPNKQKRMRDKRYTGRCKRGSKDGNDRLSWLWSQSTALYPSIYLPQRLAGSTDAALMVRHRLLEALRVASVWHHGNNTGHVTPVLPYARLAFTHSLTFLNTTDLVHTLGESAALGAAGVVLWGELKFAKSKHQCGLLRDYIHTVLGPFVKSLRSDVKRCSLQLCHGNGRCARRNPSSSHTVASSPTATSDPEEINMLTGSVEGTCDPKHFVCQCYPGWTGNGCQEEEERENEIT